MLENIWFLIGKEGAIVSVTDIHDDILSRISKEYGVSVVGTEDIYDLNMDIYAPCALGSTINDENLDRLNCGIIGSCK